MKFKHWTIVGLLMFSSLVLSVSAQKQDPKPATVEANGLDQFEAAHQGLFTPSAADKAAETSRMTAEFNGPGAVVPGDIPRKNLVDEQIFGRMERDKIPHAGLAGDEDFIRRAYIDATGIIPTSDKVREFVASKDPEKRDKLIDALIGSDEFADQWAWVYMDLFQSRNESTAYWIKQWLKMDRPYNQVFAELVGSPATKSQIMMPTWMTFQQQYYNNLRAPSPTDADNYYLENRLDFLDEITVNIGRIFLGVNFDCVSCHDGAGHVESLNMFLAEKTRAEFHQQSAFFGHLRGIATWSDRVRNISSGNMVMDDSAAGYTTGNDAPFNTMAEARFPRDGRTYEPSFILTGEKPRPGENPRQELGRILPSHIQFSRAAVNLIWGKLMVLGFVEPYDGFDLARLDPNNPPPQPWTLQPTNPWLLDAMAQDFKANNYSLHHVFKTIMKSSAYQLSTSFPGEWKDAYTPYYARKFVRVLTAPEIADVLAQATGRPYEFQTLGQSVTRVKQMSSPTGLAPRRRAAGAGTGGARPPEASDGNSLSALMQAFFQSTRETPPQISNRTSAVQAMLMMSSPAVTNRVRAVAGGRLSQLLESGKSDSQVVEELFLASLSRYPSKEETEVALRLLEKDRKVGAEDIQWVLLNTPEFLLNH